MKYSRLGNTGLIVSRLSFGVMTFGSTGPSDPRSSVWKAGQDEATALISRSIDAGINFFDAADAYADGQSEQMLGRALGPRRKDVVISTKVGFRSGQAVIQAGASFRYILAATEASLRRLNTDYIDLLSIHKPDPFTPPEETARALENLVQRGLVRYVGYSNLSAWQAAKFVGIQSKHNYSPFVAAQMYYSLVGRDIEYEIAPFCEDAGIGIVVWSPLAGGFLTGRYTREDPTGGQGRLASFDLLPHDKEKGYKLIDRMKDIGERYKASVAQVALAWLLTKPFVATVLVGASKLAQLEDNLGATDLLIAAEDIAELDNLTAPPRLYPNWFHKFALDSTSNDALHAGLHPGAEKKS
jgi:aryl-alcohol dehydrogenase-like predicted oxidoreductase